MGWGEFFALGSAFFWAVSIILFRQPGRLLPAFELNLFKNLLGFALLVPTVLLFEGFSLPPHTVREVLIALVSGYLGMAVADTWYLRALNLMGASRTGIVASLLSPFVILLSIVFLGEALRGWQIAGFALVMAGVLLVTWRQNRLEVDAADVQRGMFFGVGAVFLMAVGIVMVKEILETRPFLWTVEIRLAGGLAGMFMHILLRRQFQLVRQRFAQPLPWLQISVASFFAAYLSMVMWLAGYSLIPATVASVLNETANAWIVLLAWLFLHESLGRRKVAGLLLISVGIVVLLLA